MSATHPLDEATALTALGERRAAGATHPAYRNMAGPFGGATAATLLGAVLDDPERGGDPLALTVNFCAPIADGGFEVAWRLQRGGKTTQHWSVELVQEGRIAATASVVCARRQTTWTHRPASAPPVPPPEAVEAMKTDGMLPWLNSYRFAFVEGAPRFGEGQPETPRSPRSVVWLNDRPDRPLDFRSLAALSDAFLLRIIQVRGVMAPMGTVTLTTYFHTGAEDLAAEGAAPVLGVADARIFHDNFADQSIELWSRQGRLLASGGQMAWFKA